MPELVSEEAAKRGILTDLQPDDTGSITTPATSFERVVSAFWINEVVHVYYNSLRPS